MAYTEQEILKYMEQDRELGAAALLETYTGLLWSVCARRLEDPEDIRECVNDAFSEFCMDYKRFDGNKGSLKNYLCLIADRKALNRYRDNSRRQKAETRASEEQADREAAPGAEGEFTKEELEAALEALEPLDSQIVRMRYYEGLSYREIAEKLDLNYEAVKKRGNRSLKKLWKILVIGLIILLLAACAIIVSRYFQFAEGVGFNWNQEEPMYRMTEVSEPCEADGFTFSVTDAAYKEGLLYLWMDWKEVDAEEIERSGREYSIFLHYLNACEVDGRGEECISKKENPTNVEFIMNWQPDDARQGAEELTLDFSLRGLKNGREIEVYYVKDNEDCTETVELKGPEPSFALKLSKVEAGEELSEIGNVQRYADTGFLIRPGIREEGRTSFSLYALGPGMSGGTYRLSELLVNNFKGLGSMEPGTVTLTGEDGQVWEAESIMGGFQGGDEIVLSFPEVEPGVYTMQIPFLCLDSSQETGTVLLKMPEEVGERVPCDETMLFPDGTGIHLTGVTLLEKRKGNTEFASDVLTKYELELEPISTKELTFCATSGNVRFLGEGKPGTGESAEGQADVPELEELRLGGGISLQYGKMSIQSSGDRAPDWVELSLHEPVHILNQSFTLEVLVK